MKKAKKRMIWMRSKWTKWNPNSIKCFPKMTKIVKERRIKSKKTQSIAKKIKIIWIITNTTTFSKICKIYMETKQILTSKMLYKRLSKIRMIIVKTEKVRRTCMEMNSMKTGLRMKKRTHTELLILWLALMVTFLRLNSNNLVLRIKINL